LRIRPERKVVVLTEFLRICRDPPWHVRCFVEGMRRLVVAVVLGLGLALGACRDETTGTASTTSHVLITDPTAADQSNAASDLALAGEIRRALVADERLGMRAKNVVVVVRDGVVTLRGDVANRPEHHLVVARVVSMPGVVRIDDRIESKETRQ
jgi:osmotically-inducible protein OsmY